MPLGLKTKKHLLRPYDFSWVSERTTVSSYGYSMRFG
jgi:hypothetical protein